MRTLRLCIWLAFGAGLCFSPRLSFANDCASAAAIAPGAPATLTFDAFRDLDNAQIPGNPATYPFGDVWFEFVPGGAPGNVAQVDFQITSTVAMNVGVFLVYSESFEATGNPCQWTGTNIGYTTHYSEGNVGLAAGVPYTFDVSGLDVTGHYFLVVAEINNNGNQITAEPVVGAVTAAPANDRCANATVLTLGNGIDPAVTTGPTSGAWVNGANLTTKNATKQRLQGTCGIAPTEDHYARNFFPLGCLTNGNVANDGLTPFIPPNTPCKQAHMNTTYYKFVAPVTAPDYHIHFSSSSICDQQPNQVYAMLYSEAAGFTCGNAFQTAQSGSQMACSGTFTVAGAIPTSEYTFGGLNLTAGNTYWIVLDGDRGSQCDLRVLVSRGLINPVLPVSLLSFSGINRNERNDLYWETEREEQFSHFEVERSLDGETFELLDQIAGEGLATATYRYQDEHAPMGTAIYRLKMVDVNGGFSYSEQIELTRYNDVVTITGIVPNPANHSAELWLTLPATNEISVEILSMTGQQHWAERRPLEPGDHQLALPVQDLSPGVYLVQIRHQTGSRIEKLVVQR